MILWYEQAGDMKHYEGPELKLAVERRELVIHRPQVGMPEKDATGAYVFLTHSFMR